MSLLCINICSTSKCEYYVMALYIHNLEILEHIRKYFQDFYDFISQLIRIQSQKYQTLERFFEALYQQLRHSKVKCETQEISVL